MLLDNCLNQPRDLVGAAALAGHDHEVDGLLRLPCHGGIEGGERTGGGECAGESGRQQFAGMDHR